MQNMVQGFGEFQNPKSTGGKYSRQSSDGEGMGYYNQRLDLSELAVGGGAHSINREDNCKHLWLNPLDSNQSWYDSTSDYQEQIEKYGYIF